MGRLHKLNQQAEIAIRLHLDRLHLDMNVHRGEIWSNDSEKGQGCKQYNNSYAHRISIALFAFWDYITSKLSFYQISAKLNVHAYKR